MLKQHHDKVTEENFNAAVSYVQNNYIPRANYVEITIETTDIDTTTLQCTKTLIGSTSASHPLIGCLTEDESTKDDELEAFGTILYAETGTDEITFQFTEIPSCDFTIQVVGY